VRFYCTRNWAKNSKTLCVFSVNHSTSLQSHCKIIKSPLEAFAFWFSVKAFICGFQPNAAVGRLTESKVGFWIWLEIGETVRLVRQVFKAMVCHCNEICAMKSLEWLSAKAKIFSKISLNICKTMKKIQTCNKERWLCTRSINWYALVSYRNVTNNQNIKQLTVNPDSACQTCVSVVFALAFFLRSSRITLIVIKKRKKFVKLTLLRWVYRVFKNSSTIFCFRWAKLCDNSWFDLRKIQMRK